MPRLHGPAYRPGVMDRLLRWFRGAVAASPGQLGAVSTEYALILSLVVLVTVLAITALGVAVTGLFVRGVDAF